MSRTHSCRILISWHDYLTCIKKGGHEGMAGIKLVVEVSHLSGRNRRHRRRCSSHFSYRWPRDGGLPPRRMVACAWPGLQIATAVSDVSYSKASGAGW